jgi:hypothetical protein
MKLDKLKEAIEKYDMSYTLDTKSAKPYSELIGKIDDAHKQFSGSVLFSESVLVPTSMADLIKRLPTKLHEDKDKQTIRDWLSTCVVVREKALAWLLIMLRMEIENKLETKIKQQKGYTRFKRWFGLDKAITLLFGQTLAGCLIKCVPKFKEEKKDAETFSADAGVNFAQMLYFIRKAEEQDWIDDQAWLETQDVTYAKDFLSLMPFMANELGEDPMNLLSAGWIISLLWYIIIFFILLLIPYGYWNYAADEGMTG